MTRMLASFAMMLVAAPAFAQTASTQKLGSAEGQHVFVIDADSREWQGKLIKVSADALEIDGESGLRRFDLQNVRRVDSDGDNLRDGVIKGAVFGALMGMIFSTGEFRAQAMVGASVSYALVGLCMDAMNHSKQTVYRGKPTPAPQVAMKLTW